MGIPHRGHNGVGKAMSSLEDAAAARKQKLLALRKRKAETAGDEAAADSAADELAEVKAARTEFKFRSYDPSTGQARKHSKLDTPGEVETVEEQTQHIIRQTILEDQERRRQELDLFNIQPKKPNWDLKRDLEKRLEKLKPKTQAAINTLIRQRLSAAQKGKSSTAASAGGEDLSAAIGRRTIEEEAGAMSDEDEV